MNSQRAFDQGMASGIFLMLAANAVYWLISSWSSGVSPIRTILVIIQLVVGIGVAAWLLFQRTRYSNAAKV